MSKYYEAESVQTLINSLKCYGIPELNLDGLPTIDIVHCEECMWYNDCLQLVTSIDRTATALRWCSDGERKEE